MQVCVFLLFLYASMILMEITHTYIYILYFVYQMSRPSSRGELAFSRRELQLFKKVFSDLSKLNRWSEKNSYSEDWWSEILSIYNEMAALEGLPEQTSTDKVIHAGAELHSIFCKERAVRYTLIYLFLKTFILTFLL